MSNASCPFCDTASLAVITESEHFRAICNRFPVVKGHSLLIPKRHVVTFMSLTSEEWADLHGLSRQLITALLSVYETDSFDYALQEGTPAGRSIEHVHFHVIPRQTGDLGSPGDWYPELVRQHIDPAQRAKVELDFSTLQETASKIRVRIA
jgi:bis(5'-adenosyl)-triphosphatase